MSAMPAPFSTSVWRPRTTAIESAATLPRLMIASAMESAACATDPRVDRPPRGDWATAVDWRANAKKRRVDNVIVRRLRIVGRFRRLYGGARGQFARNAAQQPAPGTHC